jgi:hypothetical protein
MTNLKKVYLSKKNKTRLAGMLKKGETYDKAVSMLFAVYDQPKPRDKPRAEPVQESAEGQT